MKATSIVFCIIALAACNTGSKQNDLKIKESIATYLTTGVDSKDRPAIDSVSIVSVDTLTEKNSIKITLDRGYSSLKDLNAIYDSKVALIKADSALLGSMQQQADLYKKHGEKYNDASLKAQTEKMKTDSSEISESRLAVQKTISVIDSISQQYAHADSVAFFAYFVSANIFLKGGTQEPGNYIISKDWKVRR